MRLKPIPDWDGYPGRPQYFISDLGTIFRRSGDGDTVLPSTVEVRPGQRVIVDRKVYRLADLVLLAFVGPRPFGHRINYHDGDRSNVNLSNLEYVWRDA